MTVENEEVIAKVDTIPLTTKFIEKRADIDWNSTLSSFEMLFQLLHVDIVDSSFLDKSVADPKSCLLFEHLFASKIYTNSMKNRRLLARNMKIIYDDVKERRKRWKTRPKTDEEFLQKEVAKIIKLKCLVQTPEVGKHLLLNKNLEN